MWSRYLVFQGEYLVFICVVFILVLLQTNLTSQLVS